MPAAAAMMQCMIGGDRHQDYHLQKARDRMTLPLEHREVANGKVDPF
jgi:hypothetical protein